MDQQAIIDELRAIIGDYLEGQGLELIDLIYRYEGSDLFLRILTDKPEGGISLGECAGLNSRIGAMLDEKGVLERRYILEVSSPGLDRPLKTKRDFSRCLGRQIRLFLSQPVNDKIEWEGEIRAVTDDSVDIETKTGVITVAFTKINKAKQII